jgi:hypothetical protein
MASFSGPEIPNSGLVFYYDIVNTQKSWKGRPVTNQFALPEVDVNGFSVQNSTFTRIRTGNYGNYEIQPSDYVWRYNISSNDCPYHGNDVTINAGQVATFSFDYYVDNSTSNYPITNYLANFEGVVSGAFADITPSIKGVWKRATFSATAGSTGTCRMLLYPGACGGRLGDSGFILYRNPQVEFDAPGNNPSPFVAGTRSTTQAIIDLTGQNTITATSLTYASDGTFNFNGSNSMTVPFNSTAFTFNNEQTIIIWMKNQSPSGARRNPYDQAYAGAGTITHEFDSNFNYYYGTGGGNNTPYTNLNSSFSVVVGETAMICFTRNTSTVSCYKNGIFSNSMSNPYGSVVTGTNSITVGSGYAGGFAGSIYSVQLYNRALSAAEVLQNFESQRDRYGL